MHFHSAFVGFLKQHKRIQIHTNKYNVTKPLVMIQLEWGGWNVVIWTKTTWKNIELGEGTSKQWWRANYAERLHTTRTNQHTWRWHTNSIRYYTLVNISFCLYASIFLSIHSIYTHLHLVQNNSGYGTYSSMDMNINHGHMNIHMYNWGVNQNNFWYSHPSLKFT